MLAQEIETPWPVLLNLMKPHLKNNELDRILWAFGRSRGVHAMSAISTYYHNGNDIHGLIKYCLSKADDAGTLAMPLW